MRMHVHDLARENVMLVVATVKPRSIYRGTGVMFVRLVRRTARLLRTFSSTLYGRGSGVGSFGGLRIGLHASGLASTLSSTLASVLFFFRF